jgi:hypothetical protein
MLAWQCSQARFTSAKHIHKWALPPEPRYADVHMSHLPAINGY